MSDLVYKTPRPTGFVDGRWAYLNPETVTPQEASHERDPAVDEMIARMVELDAITASERTRQAEIDSAKAEELLFGDKPKLRQQVVDTDSLTINLRRRRPYAYFAKYKKPATNRDDFSWLRSDAIVDKEMTKLNVEVDKLQDVPRMDRGESGLKRRKFWQRKRSYDIRIASSNKVNTENLAIRALKKVSTARPDKKEFSLGLRLGKKTADAQDWLRGQVSLSGEHATRNKLIAGIGVLAVGYLVLKNIHINGGEPATATPADNLTLDTETFTPKRPQSIDTTTAIEPFTFELPLEVQDNIVQAPLDVVPQAQSAHITISEGGSMWSALQDQGFEGRQIVDMLHNYADQQGVSYGSLSQVDIGQTFVLEVL